MSKHVVDITAGSFNFFRRRPLTIYQYVEWKALEMPANAQPANGLTTKSSYKSRESCQIEPEREIKKNFEVSEALILIESLEQCVL